MNAETEGIELPALAELFNVRLYVYFIGLKSCKYVVFNENKGKTNIYLMFRDDRYDIIYPIKDHR